MFSGLVAGVGEVRSLRAAGGGLRLHLSAELSGGPLQEGESIAVQGACLTVSALHSGGFTADLSPETVARTTLKGLRPGRRVNLERALRFGDRIGGHLVSGHVDGTAALLGVRQQDVFRTFRVGLPPVLAPEVAMKGSVAVDGVSLTVAALGDGWFEVAVIPVTLAATTLGERRVGDQVNLETDLLAKYVRRVLAGGRPGLGELLGEGVWHAED